MKRLFLACFVFSVVSAVAQPMMFDDETTTVTFSTPHVIMLLKGTFTGVQGASQLNPSDLSKSFLKLTFGANTAIGNDPFIGPDLTKEACLDSRNYPTIQLQSEHIEKLTEENKYLFTGSLTVKNITEKVSFTFTAIPNVGGYDYDFSFPIPRKTYELNCRCGQKFQITVRGYGKKVATTG